jgi:hypothetical protein
VTRGKARRRHARASPIAHAAVCRGDAAELWRGFHCDDNIALGGIGEVDMQISKGVRLNSRLDFTFTHFFMSRRDFLTLAGARRRERNVR